jgi:autotransporter passenger strand-loop-strand repeat protein
MTTTNLSTTSANIVVSSGSVLNVTQGGVASHTTIRLSGTENVSSGGVATSSVVSSGGFANISSGGSATSDTVLTGGLETVFTGGSTTSTIVSSGGSQTISGGTATDTIIKVGGSATLLTGTMTSAFAITGGLLNVFGGTAISTTVSSGSTENVDGGTASNTIVKAGGAEFISDGGIEIGGTIAGSFTVVTGGGIVSAITVNNGGFALVSGGSAINDVVSVGGTLTLISSTASGLVVNAGFLNLSGADTAVGTVVNNAGSFTVVSSFVTGTVINSGGYQFLSGGTGSLTTVSNGGNEVVAFGGIAKFTTISNGGFQTISGGEADNTNVLSGGYLAVSNGTVLSATVHSGGTEVIAAFGSAVSNEIQAGAFAYISFTGIGTSMTVDSGAYLSVTSGGQTVGDMVSSGGFEVVSNGGATVSTIVSAGGTEFLYSGAAVSALDVLSGGMIDLESLTYSGGTAVLDGTSTSLTITEGISSVILNLGGVYTSEFFALSQDSNNGTLLTVTGVPCYCRGTLIQTDQGEVAVEDLRVGDQLINATGAARRLRWVGRRSYDGRFAANNHDVLPVLIRAGALAEGQPRRDLMVSPLHAMYLDSVLIPAAALVNGTSIVQLETVDRVDYFHLELESHDIILAEGAPSESFVDDGSRLMFHNAAEYRALYPQAARVPARYCAPRVEEGETLEAVRRRVAARAADSAPTLQGGLDIVDHDMIAGWAFDQDLPDTPVTLRILDNGAQIAELVADQFRADLVDAGIGDGRHGFLLTLSEPLAADRHHMIQVQRASDGAQLHNSPWTLRLAQPVVDDGAAATCRGALDLATRDRIAGWAQDEAQPTEPVLLQILDNGVQIAELLANRFRADLAHHGIDSGRHGFDLIIPGGLSPLKRHVISARRATDGAPLAGAPIVIDAATSFDGALEQAVASAVTAVDAADEQERVLSFMVAQTERLLQQHADAEGQRYGRQAWHQLRRRLGQQVENLPAATDPGRRALIIDERLPLTGRDAGSQAILSHAAALRGMGYQVSMVAAEDMVGNASAVAELAASGITCHGAPFYASVEEVLRRQAQCFDVVYLHRADIAARYLGLARRHNPEARIVYGVADLHHVRLERQAAIEGLPELLADARAMRLAECTAAWSADAVLTHSTAEAALLRAAVPQANVHHVPWALPVRPTEVPFAARQGVGFIGSYAHAPNLDAAHWLVDSVMPLVWQIDPAITCWLAGSDMPASVRQLERPGVVVLGHIEDLHAGLFDQVRLTVAPLRFGAGVKGKVLESLAAGVPCVMSEIAAEGLVWPAALHGLVGKDAAALAARICHLHANPVAHEAASQAGLALMARDFSSTAVANALRGAVEGLAEETALATAM